ncbi:hypothetical protein [Lactobacillus crispatus]|uniref:hypothetical protein n=1 Tax=Lactobacillus crispatus TaxID=47770 RepID=UPI0022AC5710|nr:hypothetical protein [Lactobacillus crispatus]MCZ3847170.1 hypothetical protein [Lactobacillus crispatus]MCZ3849432.1 hypothetical protein [Lactobacillus crispatus]MCZ3855368.1 hypothetical protein [Lactobacillus crispatus]MCZ3857551.1 hypothetical protein [Lactobacillus crispatus]MCZ3859887.1 hypothetical protein [Lactobacillus crispatus]
MTDETVKKTQKSVERADDTTIALDYIKSAIVVDCAESLTANDGHVLTDEEMRIVNARLLMKALTMLDDYEMQEVIRHLNDEEHTELLLKLIDSEFAKLRQEHKDNDFLKRCTQ